MPSLPPPFRRAVLAGTLLLPGGAAFAQDSPLDPPQGWRRERLEFPLSFAPELPYRGFEDLAFAPGMFVPDSDSYFSYALALRLEGEVRIDEGMLAGFLETYYRGLCAAVAPGRGLSGDPDGVRARVERAAPESGAEFVARVEMFDPFTDGRDLELRVELHTHAAPRASEVLGLASPLGSDEPVWDELHALARTWRAARPPPVLLNHVFFVVEPETWTALVGEPFLREALAVSEERTTVRSDVSYTGLYLYGQGTYFEFLPPTEGAGLVAGASGLALGLEAEGALAGLAARLREASIAARGGAITRALEGRQIPWFEILGLEMPAGPLSVFAMEYDPRFLAGWHAELAPAAGGRGRAAVLERYAAALEQGARRATAPLLEVRAVELALDDAQRERVLALAAVAGWETERDEGGATVFAPGFQLRIRASAEPGGIEALELELRHTVERPALELGRFRLSFEGTHARLARR